MIDLELYKIFVVVAEEKNITKASEKLNISQPAITKHIKNLENQLNIILFERTNKGVSLTSDGEKIYKQVSNSIHELISINSKINKSKVSIGSHNHMLNCIFGNCINKFCLELPDTDLNLLNEETDKMLQMLSLKELDIVFSKKDNTYYKDIEYFKLGELHDIFIINKNSKLASEKLKLDEIEDQIIYAPRTYAQTVNRFLELMKGRKVNLKNSSYNTILELAGSGKALGLITKEYIKPSDFEKYNLVEVKTELELGSVEFGIYVNSYKSEPTKKLIEIINKEFNHN